MTATQTDPHTTTHLVGDRVRVAHHGQLTPGLISAIHRTSSGVEYVVRTAPTDGGMGTVINLWTTSGRSPVPPPTDGGAG